MNDENLIQYAGEPLESIPEGVLEHLQADPQLKQAFEDQTRIKMLLGLKQYETPDPRMMERVGRSVRISIADYKPLRERLSFRNAHLLPAWVRMAAVVMVMMGLSVLTHQEMLRNELAEAPEPVRDTNEGVAFDSSPNFDTVQASELVHRDAFTTQLPDRFLFPLPDLANESLDFASQPQPEPTVAPFLQNPMTLPVIHISRP